ncbi:MAG: SusD/RagB family nutrient-binding outer membrane lipoprotein [Cyclobacteriaceae bacterium]
MRKIILTLIIISVFLSCDDRLEDLNRPTKAAVEVPAEPLFANGVNEMYYMMNNSNTNINVFRLYAQYWAQTTYPDESQYNMVGRRNPDNFWRGAYRDALKDLDEARKITLATWENLGLTAAERDNRLAIIDVNKVYIFASLVDAFGAIPYQEALDPEVLQPSYESGAAVYDQIIVLLDDAITKMDPAADSWPAGQDPVYEGDTQGWLKFANSLKLKLAINISDVQASKAATMVSQAIAGGIFEDNADNAAITYLDAFPNTHPIHEDLVQSGRADFVVANTLIDKLNALSDPRIAVFAEPLADGVTYEGGVYGTNNTYAQKSHIGAIFHEPTLEGLILDYAEVEFMLAEAAEKGFSSPMSAEEHYDQGIRASMEYWGVDDADIDDYLANPGVAYTTAPGSFKQKIGTQHWIALYNRGFEGWTVWRRLDFTGFNVPPLLSYSDIPNRFIFPIEEATLNKNNLTEAIQMIGGSDNVQTKVFWDIN